ncbi:MAG: hypothetical protein E2O75_03200 [Chloroflexi bacterium]|nr:MAG: hypothetical protein E2O75_03200 [Chloroflexota bacterium]
MKDSTLEILAPLLSDLRAYSVLDEVRPAAFHLGGRDFVHFHETPQGPVADVRLSRGRVHMPVSTDSEQAELLERIERQLSSLESHGIRRRHGKSGPGMNEMGNKTMKRR